MKHKKYKIKRMKPGVGGNWPTEHGIPVDVIAEKWVNEKAKEGWELVGIYPTMERGCMDVVMVMEP